jgi:hypothetical protein
MSLTAIAIAASSFILAILGAFFKGRLSGAKAERVKQVEARQEARDVADKVDSDIGALPKELKRKELGTWGRK